MTQSVALIGYSRRIRRIMSKQLRGSLRAAREVMAVATGWFSPRSLREQMSRSVPGGMSRRRAVTPMGMWFEPIESRVMLAANLSIANLNWNVIGLDSNNPASGVNQFLIGARVTNTGTDPATNVNVNFAFDESPAGTPISLVSNSALSTTSLAPGASKDFYYTVQVDRVGTAYNKTRDYHISAVADNASSVQTPAGYEFYVERLISQNRNSTTGIIAPTSVLRGSTFNIIHNAKTATSGYEQMTSELTLNPDVFEILTTSATYTAPVGGTNDHLYADAATWDSNPASPTYRTVLGTGKAGGTVVTTYTVRVRDTAPLGNYTLTGMIYDFSGSSYHYNADAGVKTATVTVKAAVGTAVGDRVWLDNNGNGVQDSGEGGVSGATVRLFNSSNVQVGPTITTGADGSYLFDDTNVSGGIPAGNYYVQFTTPSTYAFTAANVGSDDALDSDAQNVVSATVRTTAQFSLTNGQQNVSIEAGMYIPVTVSGETWRDNNGNGIQSGGDQGVGAYTVGIYDAATDVLVASANTVASGGGAGAYSLTGLAPGTYYFYIAPSAITGQGFTIKDAATSTESTDSDINPGTGRSDVFTLTSGQTRANMDAGLVNTNSIGDTVWFDTDGDGVQDPGEGGIDGVTVRLLNSSTLALVSSTTTAGGGHFQFDPSNGTYVLEFVAPNGYTFTTQDAGADDTRDSDANVSTGRTAAITITSSTGSDFKWDAGLKSVGYIGDLVWNDTDGDGVKDAGESGISGVRLNIYTEPDAGPDDFDGDETFYSTVVTDGNGAFTFSNLLAGKYWIEIDETTLPAGYLATTATGTATMVTLTNASLPTSLQNSATDFGFTNASVTTTKTITNVAPVGPGDTVHYSVTITNTSPVNAGLVTFTDLIPVDAQYQSLVVGTVITSQGSVTLGNTSGNTSVSVLVGTLAPLASATITFDVLISASIPLGTATISNFGTVTGSNFTTKVTDDPSTSGTPNDPTVTPVARPIITSLKTVNSTIVIDADSSSSISPGDTIRYNISVTNSGARDGLSVHFTDDVNTFTNLTLVPGSVVTSMGSVVASTTSVDVNLGTLAIGATANIYFDVLISALATSGSSVQNQGTVTGTNFLNELTDDPNNFAGSHDPTVTSLSARPDLTVSVDDGVSSTTPGSTLTYTVNYSNIGQLASGVVISTPLPANTSFVSATGGGSYSSGTGLVTWAIGSLAGGGSGSVTFQVLVSSTVAAGVGSIVDSISISDDASHGPDLNTANNSDSDTTTLIATPDLGITISDGVTVARNGDTLTYHVTITNNGTQGATGVVTSSTLPAGVSFVSSTQGSAAAGVVTWNIGSLAAGASTSYDIVVDVTTSGTGTLVFPATTYDDGSNGADPTSPNNASDIDNLNLVPDLNISVSDGVTIARNGDTLTYHVIVTNNGTYGATGVVTSSTLPAGVSFVSSTQGSAAAGVVTWNIGSLAAGASTSYDIVVNVTTSGTGTLVFPATTTDDGTNGTDPTTPNAASDTDNLNLTPDLVVTINDGVTTANNGDTLTYHVTITNNGTFGATGVVTTSTLPAGVSFASSTQGSESGGVVTWNIGSLAIGASVSYDIVVNVTTSGTGTLVFPATATDDGTNGTDPTTPNAVSDTDTLNPVPTSFPLAAQTVTQTSEATSTGSNVVVGEVIRYRLVFELPESNYNNLYVREYLPAGLQFMPGTANIALWSTTSGNIHSSTLSGSGLDVAETTPLVTVVPTFAVTGTEASPGGGFTDGEDILFNLGNVSNTENDSNAEYVIIEFNALVLNTAITSHVSVFEVDADAISPTISNTVTTNLVEPELEIHNTVVANGSGTFADVGDPVVYTYVIDHVFRTSIVTAFDIDFSTVIPSEVTGLSIISASILNASTHATTDVLSSFNLTGQTLTNTGNIDLLTTDTLTIKVSGTMGSIIPGTDMPNLATVTWSSLNGVHGTAGNLTGSTAPGNSGDVDGERDASGGLNDYTDSDTSTLSPPGIDFVAQKITIAPGTYYPGQTVSAVIKYANIGNTSGDAHTVTLYSSSDGTTRDRLLGTYIGTRLNPGARNISLSWVATTGDAFSDGTNDGSASNYLIAVVDEGLLVDETNENNNVVVTSAADYVVSTPVVSILPHGTSGADLQAEEGSVKSGRFVFQRTGPLSQPLTITVSFAGTTTAGDFTGSVFPTQTVTFNANQSTASIYISPIVDTADVAPETLIATIVPDTSSPLTYRVGVNTQTMTVNGVMPTVNLSVPDATASETSQGTGTFRLSRPGGANTKVPLTVPIDISGTATLGTDYVLKLGSALIPVTGNTINLTIPAPRTFIDFKVYPVDDTIDDANETVTATIRSSPLDYNIGTNNKTVTIADNDAMNIRVLLSGKNQTIISPTDSGPNKIPIVTLTITNTEVRDSFPTNYQVRLIKATGRPLTIQDYEDSTYAFPFVALPRIRAGKTVTMTFLIRLSFMPALEPGVYYAAVKVDAGNSMMNEKSETDNYGFATAQFTVVDPTGGNTGSTGRDQ